MGSVTIQLFVHRLAPHIITLHEKFRLVGMMATTGMQEAVTRTDRLAVRLSRLRKVGYALSDGIRTAETAGATPAVVAHLVNLHEKSECPGSAVPLPLTSPHLPRICLGLSHTPLTSPSSSTWSYPLVSHDWYPCGGTAVHVLLQLCAFHSSHVLVLVCDEAR